MAQIILFPQRECFLAPSSWTKWKRLPAECRWYSVRCGFMRASDLDLFDVRSEQQMPTRWQVGWNVLWSLALQHQGEAQSKDCVWSSPPGGRSKKILPAACQPHLAVLNSKKTWEAHLFLVTKQLNVLYNMMSFHVCRLLRVQLSTQKTNIFH